MGDIYRIVETTLNTGTKATTDVVELTGSRYECKPYDEYDGNSLEHRFFFFVFSLDESFWIDALFDC